MEKGSHTFLITSPARWKLSARDRGGPDDADDDDDDDDDDDVLTVAASVSASHLPVSDSTYKSMLRREACSAS